MWWLFFYLFNQVACALCVGFATKNVTAGCAVVFGFNALFMLWILLVEEVRRS